jgi:hypothetical protein
MWYVKNNLKKVEIFLLTEKNPGDIITKLSLERPVRKPEES